MYISFMHKSSPMHCAKLEAKTEAAAANVYCMSCGCFRNCAERQRNDEVRVQQGEAGVPRLGTRHLQARPRLHRLCKCVPHLSRRCHSIRHAYTSAPYLTSCCQRLRNYEYSCVSCALWCFCSQTTFMASYRLY